MPVTTVLLYEGHQYELQGAAPAGEDLWMTPSDLQQLGWSLEPEGMCQGERCVPAPDEMQLIDGEGRVNFSGFSRYLGAPVLSDADSQTWVVGSEPPPAFPSLVNVAPDFSLPDLQGTMHSLSQHRGRKVFLVSWASW